MKKRVLSLLLSTALGLSLASVALAEEPVVARPARLPDVGEIVLTEEPWAEEPAQPLADVQSDYAGAAEALCKGMAKREERIYDLGEYHIPVDDASFQKLFHYMRYRYGELFALGLSGTYRQSGGYMTSYAPEYTLSAQEYAAAQDFYNKELDAIVAQVPAGATDAEKVLFIHDYLASHYEYDYDFQNYDAYSFLRDGKGVCQAYMLVFSALMDRLGVNVSYVESENLNHAWNVVELDGKWYHVDATWDDPAIGSKDESGVEMSAEVLGAVGHDFFLLSDATNDARRQERIPHDKDYICGEDYIKGKSVVTCPDKTYETGLYADADSPVVYVAGNDSWYYVSTDKADRGLYRWRKGEAGAERLGDYSTTCSGGIAPLVEYQGSLFFSSPKEICRYELATDTMTTLFTQPDATNDPLSGIRIADGALSYKLRKTEALAPCGGEIMPYHDTEDGAFSYYYNFGAVGLKLPEQRKGQVLIAWYDPANGMMKKLEAVDADGAYGTAVEDKDLACAIFVLSTDGKLLPIQPKFTVHAVPSAPAQ